ncbi:MAG: 3-hydroxyacyl-CoA dehydrogenase NAD-binding domain-containing protein, partial [Candidatus Krumholzibacteriia bacterium]
MAIEKVGVVGCGLMGSGIAQVCATSGYETTVLEVDENLLHKGLEKIRKQLSRSVDKGKLQASEMETIVGRLKGTTSLADLGSSDVV